MSGDAWLAIEGNGWTNLLFVDGHDVLGVLAANDWTAVTWAVAALVLLLAAYWPAPEG